jgi:hypothetical protein
MATPGEHVTVTPAGMAPPPVPAGGQDLKKGGMRAFATGGQMTLGDAFGLPSVPKTSADLISAHASASLSDQTSSLGTKIDDMGSRIIQASNDSTGRIMSAIGSVSKAIPDPTGTAASSPTTAAPSAPVYDAATIAAAVAQRYAALQQGAQTASPTAAPAPRSSGLPHFATGGQMTVDDSAGMGLGGVGADIVSSALDRKTDSQTAAIKGKIDSTTSKVVSAINGSGNHIADGVSSIKDRFEAWRSSVNISSQASASPRSGVGNATKPMSPSMYGPSYNLASASDPYSMFLKQTVGLGIAVGGAAQYPWAYGQGGGFGQNPALMAAAAGGGGSYNYASPFGGMAEGGTFMSSPAAPAAMTAWKSASRPLPASASWFCRRRRLNNSATSPLPSRSIRNLSASLCPTRPAITPQDSSVPMGWKGSLNDNIPGSSYIPRPSMMPDNSSAAVVGRVVPAYDPSSNPNQSARNVNIYVQQGVQADQFIRSRAEMQRAMGR